MSNTISKLEDFCSISDLFYIVNNWSISTGLSAIIIDNFGNPISESFGTTPICALIHSSTIGKEKCHSNWESKITGLHKCHAGLYDFAIPLTLPDGTTLGRVQAGQILTDEQSFEEIYNNIKDSNLSEQEVYESLNNTPRKRKSEMIGSYNLLYKMISIFIEKCYLNYQERQARKIDIELLTAAVKTVYRISMYFNVTKNQYHLIDYDTGVSSIVPLSGSIDDIVNIGVQSIPDTNQSVEYYKLFNRNALIEAYNKGIKEIKLQHQQRIYNGEIHWMEGRAIFVPSNDNEIHAICLSRIIDEEISSKLSLTNALKESEIQKELLQEALDNYKQADYDRRRDFLTGLRNRQDMYELLNDKFSVKRKKIKSMFMMDIDNFKSFNDNYGHIAGDSCLQRIGQALNKYGDRNNMYFYRYGGEELLGICFSLKKDCNTIAEEIVKVVSNLNIERDDSAYNVVTVSLGYTDDYSDYNNMIDKADKAMYIAKNNGKNQSIYYKDS